jgi:hypothetical protein
VSSLLEEQNVRKDSLLHFKIEISLDKVILHCSIELADDIVIPITLVLATFI